MLRVRRLIDGQKHHWEYYNRFRFVSDRIKQLGDADIRVLDVGGATGDNLLREFGVSNVTTLDTNPNADIVCSADDIHLEDSSYDVVTCIDTLEHIPKDAREQVIREIVRVASEAVLLVAPVDSAENNQAEEIVLRYTKNRFIAEHQTHGLVDFDLIESLLRVMQEEGTIRSFDKTLLDDLLNWVTMMTRRNIFHFKKIYQEAHFLENRFCPRRIALSIYVR
jgi:2-polyprenyl-3-methyl-5-hydroxy-6-metoxy-1,4-benzoquinol methylase